MALNFQIVSAHHAPIPYRGRGYWEQHFREIGAWPPFMHLDRVSACYSDEIDARFGNLQLIAIESSNNEVAAIANVVALRMPAAPARLPDTGWDWALQTAIEQHRAGVEPDSVASLSITVLPKWRRQGLGGLLIREVADRAREHGLRHVIAPVRPMLKARQPELSIDDFLALRRADGFHVDPWIRAHERTGAAIAGPCHRSMVIEAPLALWETWEGRTFREAGMYVVRGCLARVSIDVERSTGTYIEPNVWMKTAIG